MSFLSDLAPYYYLVNQELASWLNFILKYQLWPYCIHNVFIRGTQNLNYNPSIFASSLYCPHVYKVVEQFFHPPHASFIFFLMVEIPDMKQLRIWSYFDLSSLNTSSTCMEQSGGTLNENFQHYKEP